MNLEDKHIALFVAKLYEDLEFWYPYYRMIEAGARVTVIGPDKNKVTGKHGLPAQADKSIDEANASDYDALIIPGGYSPDHMRRSRPMVEFVKTMSEQNKLIASICHGPWMMASADIVKGKKVTSFYSIVDDLVHAGAEWQDKEVVRDGNLITSRNPGDLPVFCKTFIETLA